MFTRSLLRSSAAIPRRLAQPARRHYASQGFRDKSAIGPFTWKAASLFVLTGAGLYVYFESEKSKIQERKRAFRRVLILVYVLTSCRPGIHDLVCRETEYWRTVRSYCRADSDEPDAERLYGAGSIGQVFVDLLWLYELPGYLS